MSKDITLREANRAFARCVRDVEAGAEYIITRNGRPVSRLMPASGRRILAQGNRPLALALGLGRAWKRAGPSALYLSTAAACMSAESARLTLIGDMSDGNALGRLRIHDSFAASGGLTGMTRRLLSLADLCL
jgi:prevent-host-death family protein